MTSKHYCMTSNHVQLIPAFKMTFRMTLRMKFRKTFSVKLLVTFNLSLWLCLALSGSYSVFSLFSSLELDSEVERLFFLRSTDDGYSAPECFERDNIDVDTEEVFTNNCEDIHGNKFEENSETSSCCGCLM